MMAERAIRCGFVFTPGVMLVVPKQAADFFAISRTFVNLHLTRLGWEDHTFSPEAFRHLHEVFPPEVLDSSFMAPRGLQIRFYTPVQAIIQTQSRAADQPTSEQHADRDEIIPGDGGALEEEAFENMADSLSHASPPEMGDLDVTLDRTIAVIEDVIMEPLEQFLRSERVDVNHS
jgi:hypothetical protein